MKRLSIILPVYNVEKYLSECLDSLLNQDIPFDEYEILIINDGSTDGSFTIAKSYANQYSNIIIFSQESTGIGAARNKGIHESDGKYLFFVDSDDYIQPNCLRELLDCIERKKLDLLRFNFEAINERGIKIIETKNSTYSKHYSERIVDGESFLADYLGWACYVWLYFFDASFIKNNNLFFSETIYFEDVDWLVRVLLATKRVQSVNKNVYIYRQHPGSVTQSTQIEKKNKIVTDKQYILDILKHTLQKSKNKKVILWCNGMISHTIMAILDYVENELPERKKDAIQFIYKHKFLPLKSYHFTLKQKRNVYLINISPLLFCFLKRRR